MPTNHGQVIVVGNEKGGCGKSTTAMHLIIGLLEQGYHIASVDLDLRQSTLSRYLANRKIYANAVNKEVAMPLHYSAHEIMKGDETKFDHAAERLQLLVDGARVNHDILIIDTPGSDNQLSRFAHETANLLVTPVNDSFVDLDVLGHINAQKKQLLGPSHYSEMVLEKRRYKKEQNNGDCLNWFVIRNRMGTLNSHNTQDVEWALAELSNALEFKILPGLSERVIFREMFLVGLTILDLKDASGGKPLNQSHLSARKEVLSLVSAIVDTLMIQSS